VPYIESHVGAERREPEILEDESSDNQGRELQRKDGETDQRYERDQPDARPGERRGERRGDHQREHDREHTDQLPELGTDESRHAPDCVGDPHPFDSEGDLHQ
jgi:hypothetical protein